MLDPPDADPAPLTFARTRAVPPEFVIEACNFELALAVLADGCCVPITCGYLAGGEVCDVDDPGLYAFVCGSDLLGWQWRYRADFDCGGALH